MQTFDFGFWKLHARHSPVFFQGRFFVVVSSLSLIIYTLNLLIILCTFIVYSVHLTYLCTILFFAAIFGFLETLFLENLIQIQKPQKKITASDFLLPLHWSKSQNVRVARFKMAHSQL